MPQQTHTHPRGTEPQPPNVASSLVGSVTLLFGMFALLVAASYPVYAATAAITVTLAVVVLRRALPALGRRLRGYMTELDVPGFGTVEIRVNSQ
ncbi:uncharacterized protein Nmag_1875 [Natrialba magadii ATCC 43099]|uniref:Uncharacterized protein n=1 Tax=Natrialba magadii (strain ATCC 43099 / DSM 3394 / CCM 3739 / CIP 104546 / IAM 13178 / JCM 8861 / NBRC 102185 / NCIMB 2190 / MS3) TaxID=547559 RepID=D3SV40_NATMM|nr:hypothetical protein [Natrialba magadii]ADD05448.1 uncharacterized protein Nmag_1875 [Natrialba magadii ATCC 43099]ELY29238.1 hypothetical protein C500_10990 [Natrialba magadii ATCC 43099]